MFSSLMGTICNSLVMKFVLKIHGSISFIMQIASVLLCKLSRHAAITGSYPTISIRVLAVYYVDEEVFVSLQCY